MKTVIGQALRDNKIINEYDINKLMDAYLKNENIDYKNKAEKLFQQGLILHNIHFSHFIAGNKKDAKEYGNQAEEKYSQALTEQPDFFEAEAFRCMLYQVMSSFDWQCGALYGPKGMNAMKQLMKNDPENFYVRVILGYSYLETPEIFGGNLKKAMESFIDLKIDNPDNEDIKVLLAKAFYKEKKYEMAKKEIDDVLEDNPENLFAQKVNTLIEKKIK